MQAWRSHLEEYGPRWVSWGLGALIAAELVRAALVITAGHPSPQAAAGLTRAPPRFASAANVDALKAMHLFGRAAPAPNGDPEDAPASTANLTLVGTLASQDAKQGLAIITAESGAKVYKVGDEVDGASLHAVYRDRVTLERGGTFETVSLPRFRGGNAAASHRLGRPARNAVPNTEAQSGEQHLADIMRVDPLTNGDSDTLMGFRIRPGTDRSVFFRSGLHPGDLITSVNGTPVAGGDRKGSQDAMNTMLASGSGTVSVMRNGKPVDIALNLSQ